jgi:hypothetical protein
MNLGVALGDAGLEAGELQVNSVWGLNFDAFPVVPTTSPAKSGGSNVDVPELNSKGMRLRGRAWMGMFLHGFAVIFMYFCLH